MRKLAYLLLALAAPCCLYATEDATTASSAPESATTEQYTACGTGTCGSGCPGGCGNYTENVACGTGTCGSGCPGGCGNYTQIDTSGQIEYVGLRYVGLRYSA